MEKCLRTAGLTVSLVTFVLGPALAKGEKGADAWVAQARIEISAGRLDVARRNLETAIKKTPDHADAHFLLCGVELAEAERLFRGYGTQDEVDYELYDAETACAEAAEHNQDPKRRASLLASSLRTQVAGRRWVEAAATFQAMIAASANDGRLVGGYAAMLDRAGKKEEAASALEGATARGDAFDRAARFEYVWDRYDCTDAKPLAPSIEKLRREESDPARAAILDLLKEALDSERENISLAFLGIVESNVLTQAELERLWTSVAGPPPRGQNKAWLGPGRDLDGAELPKLVSKVEPHYPEYPRERREQGRVELLTRIEKDGTVGPIWIMRSSGPSFAGAAIQAVREWRYTPARRAGEAVAFPYTIRVDFRLR